MAVDKSFVVKNGLEVNSDLIVADASSKKVGIASTGPRSTLDVRGGIAATDINITGVSTFGTVQIASGIVTATSGVVTYYGDGSNLTGIATNLTATIGVGSESTFIGAGITQIDFNSTNGTAISVDVPPATAAGVATVTFTPGVSLGLAIALGG